MDPGQTHQYRWWAMVMLRWALDSRNRTRAFFRWLSNFRAWMNKRHTGLVPVQTGTKPMSSKLHLNQLREEVSQLIITALIHPGDSYTPDLRV